MERSDEYKSELLEFIKREYGVECSEITPARRGFYGETWRVNKASTSYFVKLDYSPHQDKYERSFPVIERICDHGIDFISRIKKTTDGRLSTRFDGAVLGMFDWIDGENIQTNATKIPEYQMLAKVYTVPAHGLSISREEFSDISADKFFEQWNTLEDKQLQSLLEKNRAKLEHRASRLKHFAKLCQGDTAGFFITHGDAGGNFLVSGDKYFIVDWDEPLLAPPERDAWVMCSQGWARDAFHYALRQSNIVHSLRSERLAYYCYHYFFYYLTSYLDGYKPKKTVCEIEEYIDGWMEGSMRYADGNF